ncbi:MAG TPA: hypothetical protein V6D29_07960 [Leptolyngbyaceae cyanobacterium]
MISLRLSDSHPKESLIRRFLEITVAVFIIWFMSGNCQPARAEVGDAVIIDMPVYGQIISNDLVAQAEALATNAVNQQFRQNPALSEVKVVVMGNRYGEIIPVLTANASRSEWQADPQISAWAQYYSASYALLQRHDLQESSRVVRATPNTSTVNALALVSQIDQAYDKGRLTGAGAQEYLDYF